MHAGISQLRDVLIRTVCVLGAVTFTSACGPERTFQGATAPTPVPSPIVPRPNPPPATFPNVEVGAVVRFQFTTDDYACNSQGRCRSYSITPPSDGRLEVVLTPVSPDSNFIGKTDLYLVPGADDWTVGPGNRISVNAVVRSGGTYEIRMFSSQIPSDEFELRTSLR